MYFKNFFQFITEGARWNSDKSGVIVSLENHPDDMLKTPSKLLSTAKGYYDFKVYIGMVTDIKHDDLKKKDDAVKINYADLMERLKQGYFNMVAPGEPEHKITKDSMHKGAQSEMNQYDEKLFFDFMKKTGKIDKLKYVVMAESTDDLVNLMAEVISKNTGAEIIKLRKKEYTNLEILKFYKNRPAIPFDDLPKEKRSVIQDEIISNYLSWVEKNEEAKKKLKAGEMSAEEILSLMGYATTGGPFLQNLLKDLKKGPLKISGKNKFNQVRGYLNTKYDFNEEFIEKVRECLLPNSDSKMLIIDDNIQSGSDFREVMTMCSYVVDVLQITEKPSLSTLTRTEELRKKILASATKTQKEELQKLLRDVEISKRSKVDNITGYVLYERPSLLSSKREDTRD